MFKILRCSAIGRLKDHSDIVLGRFGESQQGRQLGRGLTTTLRTDVPAFRREKIRTNIQLRNLPTDRAHGIADTPVQLDGKSMATHVCHETRILAKRWLASPQAGTEIC